MIYLEMTFAYVMTKSLFLHLEFLYVLSKNLRFLFYFFSHMGIYLSEQHLLKSNTKQKYFLSPLDWLVTFVKNLMTI